MFDCEALLANATMAAQLLGEMGRGRGRGRSRGRGRGGSSGHGKEAESKYTNRTNMMQLG